MHSCFHTACMPPSDWYRRYDVPAATRHWIATGDGSQFKGYAADLFAYLEEGKDTDRLESALLSFGLTKEELVGQSTRQVFEALNKPFASSLNGIKGTPSEEVDKHLEILGTVDAKGNVVLVKKQ